MHSLYDESKHMINVINLYDNILQKNHVTLTADEIGYDFFKFEFSHSSEHNLSISDEYMKSKVYM